MGYPLVSNNLSPIPFKISFHMKNKHEKKVTRCGPKFTNH